TAAGEDRARRLAARLQGASFIAVYASPMQRAQKTAALAGYPNFEVTPLLQEYDYGEYEGVTSKEIRRTRPDWELFRDGCPGGETPEQVYRRAQQVVEMIARKTTEGSGIAFAHGHLLPTGATARAPEPGG